MKQLYATLEDKEKELRDFIRNYEQVRAPNVCMGVKKQNNFIIDHTQWKIYVIDMAIIM